MEWHELVVESLGIMLVGFDVEDQLVLVELVLQPLVPVVFKSTDGGDNESHLELRFMDSGSHEKMAPVRLPLVMATNTSEEGGLGSWDGRDVGCFIALQLWLAYVRKEGMK